VYTCDSRRGFGLDIGFFGHFNTQLVILINYSSISNFHTSKLTPAHDKPFPACSVFSSRFLVTAFNSGCSSASVFKSSLNGGSLLTARYNLLTSKQASISHQLHILLFPVWFSAQVKVKVTLRPTVSQAICLGVRHPLGTYEQTFSVWQLRVCWCGALSLSRGRVCGLELRVWVLCYDRRSVGQSVLE
jgi:hypothetical protein